MGKKRQKSKKSLGEVGRFLVLYLFFRVVFLLVIGLDPLKRMVDLNGLYTAMVVKLTVLALKPLGMVRGLVALYL